MREGEGVEGSEGRRNRIEIIPLIRYGAGEGVATSSDRVQQCQNVSPTVYVVKPRDDSK